MMSSRIAGFARLLKTYTAYYYLTPTARTSDRGNQQWSVRGSIKAKSHGIPAKNTRDSRGTDAATVSPDRATQRESHDRVV